MEFSQEKMQELFANVQNSWSPKRIEMDLIEWLPVKVVFYYNNETYVWEIRTEIWNLFPQEELDRLIGFNRLMKWKWEKWIFMDLMFEAVSKTRKRMIELGLKVENALEISMDDLDDVFGSEEMTEEEMKELGLPIHNKESEEEKLRKAREREKNELLIDLSITNDMISFEDDRLWEYEISLKNPLKFPLREWMICYISPDLYVPYIYYISLEDVYHDGRISFISKWMLSDSNLKSLLKKFKYLNIKMVYEKNGAEYDIQEHLVKIIKNPYFGFNWKLLETLKQSSWTCRFCWTAGFVTMQYSQITTYLEVGAWRPTEVVEPFKIYEPWVVEQVGCGNCQRSLTSVSDFWDRRNKKQYNINEIFSEFKCSDCHKNAFQDPMERKLIKVVLENAVVRKTYNVMNGLEEKLELISSWNIVKIFCQEDWCLENGAFYK